MAKNTALEALLELHRVDSEIDKITSQEQLLPVSLRRIETRLTRQLESIEERKGRLKGLRAQTHAKEVELRAQEEVIEKFNQQIRKIRTIRSGVPGPLASRARTITALSLPMLRLPCQQGALG